MNFDLQQYLKEMRDDQREDHKEVVDKLDAVIVRVQDHETRIVVVENTRKTMRWLTGTVIVALVGALLDFLVNHGRP
jgi:hypothetical protein